MSKASKYDLSLTVVPAWTLTKEERSAFLAKKPCYLMTTAETKVWLSAKLGEPKLIATKAAWDAALARVCAAR